MFQGPPTILGPGQGEQWNLTPQFEYLAESISRIFTSRDIVVLPAHQ